MDSDSLEVILQQIKSTDQPWSSSLVAALIDKKLLKYATDRYSTLTTGNKMRIIFSLAALKRNQYQELDLDIQQFLKLAAADMSDEWVTTISLILQNVSKGNIDYDKVREIPIISKSLEKLKASLPPARCIFLPLANEYLDHVLKKPKTVETVFKIKSTASRDKHDQFKKDFLAKLEASKEASEKAAVIGSPLKASMNDIRVSRQVPNTPSLPPPLPMDNLRVSRSAPMIVDELVFADPKKEQQKERERLKREKKEAKEKEKREKQDAKDKEKRDRAEKKAEDKRMKDDARVEKKVAQEMRTPKRKLDEDAMMPLAKRIKLDEDEDYDNLPTGPIQLQTEESPLAQHILAGIEKIATDPLKSPLTKPGSLTSKLGPTPTGPNMMPTPLSSFLNKPASFINKPAPLSSLLSTQAQPTPQPTQAPTLQMPTTQLKNTDSNFMLSSLLAGKAKTQAPTPKQAPQRETFDILGLLQSPKEGITLKISEEQKKFLLSFIKKEKTVFIEEKNYPQPIVITEQVEVVPPTTRSGTEKYLVQHCFETDFNVPGVYRILKRRKLIYADAAPLPSGPPEPEPDPNSRLMASLNIL